LGVTFKGLRLSIHQRVTEGHRVVGVIFPTPRPPPQSATPAPPVRSHHPVCGPLRPSVPIGHRPEAHSLRSATTGVASLPRKSDGQVPGRPFGQFPPSNPRKANRQAPRDFGRMAGARPQGAVPPAMGPAAAYPSDTRSPLRAAPQVPSAGPSQLRKRESCHYRRHDPRNKPICRSDRIIGSIARATRQMCL